MYKLGTFYLSRIAPCLISLAPFSSQRRFFLVKAQVHILQHEIHVAAPPSYQARALPLQFDSSIPSLQRPLLALSLYPFYPFFGLA